MATPELPTIELATFRTLTGSPTVEFEVHFNPASLEYSVSNTLKEEGRGSKKKQYIDKTSAKLTMQLVFDTTHSGEDVRVHTDKVAALLEPVGDGKKQVPPNVEFGWGLYRFTGMVEKHKETLDFFAPSGVPLRATVDLTLASQDVQFGRRIISRKRSGPAVVPGGKGPSGLANDLGDPRAARAIAAANGSASLRFGAEGSLAVDAGVELKGEASFSAGASAGAGFGIGIGGGAGASIGGGLSAGASLSAGAGASAGGAFSERRSGVSVSASPPSARVLFETDGGASVGGGAQFGVGGRVTGGGGGSLGADVGVDAELDSSIRFE